MKNIKEYTMEELMEFNRIFTNEIECRRRAEREEDWNNLVNTIKDYIKKYGSIEILQYGEESLFIDITSRFDTIEEIEL